MANTNLNLNYLQNNNSLSNLDINSAFFAGKNINTLNAYKKDLKDFANFLKLSTIEQAILFLFAHIQGQANLIIHQFKTFLIEKKLSPASINRKLSAIRSIVRQGNIIGVITFEIKIPNVRSQSYRDTRGPGLNGVKAILSAIESKDNKKAIRDKAIIELLYTRALRRQEIVNLNLSDCDLENSAIKVLGKGRTEKEILSVPESLTNDLKAWIVLRGSNAGPLFTNLDNAGKKGSNNDRRLTGSGIYYLVRGYGKMAGIKTAPHALRHASITVALDRTKDIRAVQRFSRHKNIRTLLIYDDNRQDLGGKISELVSISVHGKDHYNEQ